MKIFALGNDTDNTFRHFLYHGQSISSVRIQPINLRAVADRGDWCIEPNRDCRIFLDGVEQKISPGDAVYVRLFDAKADNTDEKAILRWQNLRTAITSYLQLHDAVVVNRPFSGAHNAAKPLHESLIRSLGLDVPDSLSSSSTTVLRDFCNQGPSVLKALSGIRANCKAVDLNTFSVPFDGPVYVQRRIYGYDLRVHVVGSECHTLKIRSSILDYRMKTEQALYSEEILPQSLKEKLVAATSSFNLAFAGWDFKVDKEGKYWCLEANPMPGYSGYDHSLDGKITKSLIELLESSFRKQSEMARKQL